TQTYTDVEVEGENTYEIRVVYDGDKEDYSYYAMSCPQAVTVADNPCLVTPDNLTGTYEWVTPNQFGALIGWTYGEGAEWLTYDDGTIATYVGEGDSGLPFYWGMMIPAADLALYNGFSVTRVAFPEYEAAGNYTINIYMGGTNAPGTLVCSEETYASGTSDWQYVDLAMPVAINPNQNLWVILYNDGDITYPAAACANTGDANGRWTSEDGNTWFDLAAAGLNYTWMVRAFVTNAVEPEELVALEPFNGGGTTTMSFSAVEANNTLSEFNLNSNNREPVSFNVYRDGAVVANVPYTGEYRYEYLDNVAAGNYEYQVTAVYEACESDFALTPDLLHNYVEVTVTGVNEIVDSRIYPNPTTGNVTIEAQGMNHITVFSALGQVVYDSNISGDTYTMNLGQYQAGLYMVRIFTENGVSVKRVTLVK
nr:T9SS type A sorting domain-containing protein [Bacteroidales bacterium]